MAKKIRLPRTADINKYIDCDVKTDNGEFVPFTAVPGDSLGDEIYQKAKAGEYGVVSIAPSAGYAWNGKKWAAVPLAQLVAIAELQRNALFTKAAESMAPLQDAVDIDEATDKELATLSTWKKYRVALNRLDLSVAPDITWPEMPTDVA